MTTDHATDLPKDWKRRHLDGCLRCGRWGKDEDARLMCCCDSKRYAEMHPEPQTPATMDEARKPK